ncbi:MAG: hypothetical protein KC656_00185, partial [Myxococcales bacterium]|nr:hypothetical protein [Myxococcales bacterium]
LWFLVARRTVEAPWARLAILLAATSPAWLIASSTLTSHTSTTLFLSAALWAGLRAGDEDGDTAHDVLFFAAYCAAFWIRPTSTLGAGVGLLPLWAWGVWRTGRLGGNLVAAGAVVAAGAGLFLAVSHLLYGSVTGSGYGRYIAYALSNHGRFSTYDDRTQTFVFSLEHARTMAAASFLRIDEAFFGWPVGLVFLPFARRSAAVWGWLVGGVLVHAFVMDVGVETLGPLHHLELFTPVLLLTVDGAERLAKTRLPTVLAIIGSGAALALLVSWPVRTAVLARSARSLAPLFELTRPLDDALVFAPWPIYCNERFQPTVNLTLARPANRPSLDGRVVWANHLSVEADRRLWRTHFPERRAFVFTWSDPVRCEARLLDLAGDVGSLGDGSVGGDGYLEPAYR